MQFRFKEKNDEDVLTLKTTKPTWWTSQVTNELTKSFGYVWGVPARWPSSARDKNMLVCVGRAVDLLILRLRQRKEHVSALRFYSLKTRLLVLRSLIPNSTFNVLNVVTL